MTFPFTVIVPPLLNLVLSVTETLSKSQQVDKVHEQVKTHAVTEPSSIRGWSGTAAWATTLEINRNEMRKESSDLKLRSAIIRVQE